MDLDFDGQLSVLVDIEELPVKGTLGFDDSSTVQKFRYIIPHVPLTRRLKNYASFFL